MGRKRANISVEDERNEQYERGQRIKFIREQELHMSKTALAKHIGTSSQFLGLVEEGKGNLVYYSIKKLRQISGHSSDYILFGVDDESIAKTRKFLSEYSEEQLADALYIIRKLTHFVMDEKI
jgi:transcriptional regulator with XRE-family HTH domain